MATNSSVEIDPMLQEAVDRFFLSAGSVALSALAGWAALRYNTPFAAPGSLGTAMTSVNLWRKAWESYDAYKATR